MSLTGRFNFRKTLTGKIILQVEEDVKGFWRKAGKRVSRRRWRDARVMDLTAPEMRALIDLRQTPQFMPQSYAPVAAVGFDSANIENAPKPSEISSQSYRDEDAITHH
jgi:hypothetical protein